MSTRVTVRCGKIYNLDTVIYERIAGAIRRTRLVYDAI